MKRVLVLLAVFSVVLAPAIAHADTLINFDDLANGDLIGTHYTGLTFSNPLPLPDGTDGAFARNAALVGDTTNVLSVYALDSTFPFDPGASNNGAFNNSDGVVQIEFASGVGRVGVDARAFRNSGDALGTTDLGPYLELYTGSAGSYTEISLSQQDYSTLLGSGSVGPWQTLSYTSATNNITMVRLGVQYSTNVSPAVFGYFDNLTFGTRDLASGQFPSTGVTNPTPGGGDNGNGGNGGTPVPEPASIVLLAGGLFGLAAGRKRLAS